MKTWVRCRSCREQVPAGSLLCPQCGAVVDKQLRQRGWQPSASLRAELVPARPATQPSSPPAASGGAAQAPEGSWRDVVIVLLVIAAVGFLAVKGCGAILAEPDARFQLSDCVVNGDGSVTVVGTVTNDGASGTVNVEPYAVVMGGERHSTGFMDFETGEIESGETVRLERRITLDSGEIPTGECGADVL